MLGIITKYLLFNQFFMKAVIQLILFSIISILLVKQGNAQSASKDSSVSFKVFGLCVQCKHRIEEALKIRGVEKADWDIDSKMLSLSYDPSRISLDKIHNKITAVGHDTYLKKANDAVYNALPSCCHYRDMEKM